MQPTFEERKGVYQALFGSIEDLIKDKQLFLVPSGALTQLPFQVLITDKPDPALRGTEALRHAAWLIRSHALTVLPCVSSLKALRQLAKESHASRALIGFGNPLLDGPDARYVTLAAAARSKTSCPELSKQRVTALTGKRRGVLPLSLRSGLADGGEIRSQVPLPETADELCAVARALGASEKDIWLGDRATEAEIKRLTPPTSPRPAPTSLGPSWAKSRAELGDVAGRAGRSQEGRVAAPSSDGA
jgi:CHAT domain